MSSLRARTLVVGGGVVGLMVARELLQGGEPVTLLEARHIGAGASWAAGGILSPLYPWRYSNAVTALSLWSQRHYPALVETLTTDTGVDAQWRRSGLLSLDVADHAEAVAWARSHRQELESLSGAGVVLREPTAAPAQSALWWPEIAQVRSPRLLRALAADVRQRGGVIEEQSPVTQFEIRDQRVIAATTPTRTVPVDRCVVTAGAWTGALLSLIGRRLPVSPVQGQMIRLDGGGRGPQAIVLSGSRYAVPRADGSVVVGSTLEPTGADVAVPTDSAKEALRRAAGELIPGLADALVLDHWAGLRPSAPGGVPFVGRSPVLANLFVCAGHFRNGIVLAPASARLIADLVLGRRPVVDPSPYGLTRDLTLEPL